MSEKRDSSIIPLRQIFDVVVAVFQGLDDARFVDSLGRCQRGVIFRGNRAENTHFQCGGDFCGGKSLEFRDSLAPVAVIDDFTPEALPVHKAAQEEIAHNLFAVQHEEREERLVLDDFREGFLVEGVRFEEPEGFFGLFGEELGEGSRVGGGCQPQCKLVGEFLQNFRDFLQCCPVGQRKNQGVAPFNDVPEEPELVAEYVSEFVKH